MWGLPYSVVCSKKLGIRNAVSIPSGFQPEQLCGGSLTGQNIFEEAESSFL